MNYFLSKSQLRSILTLTDYWNSTTGKIVGTQHICLIFKGLYGTFLGRNQGLTKRSTQEHVFVGCGYSLEELSVKGETVHSICGSHLHNDGLVRLSLIWKSTSLALHLRSCGGEECAL